MTNSSRKAGRGLLFFCLCGSGLVAACSDSDSDNPAVDAASDAAGTGDAVTASDSAFDVSTTADGAVDANANAVDATADGASDGATFALLVTESPPGPSNGDKSNWGGVLQYTVAGDGALLVPATGIPATMLADPAGLAFRASSSELFVGNRHGNNAADGVAGSISRFAYDGVARTFTPTTTITGPTLNGVHSLAFSPTTGELFAANYAGCVARFTFDAGGVATAHGTLGDGSCRGVLVSPDGKRLFVTSATATIRQFDLDAGTEVMPPVTVPSSPVLHYFALRGDHVYVAGLDNGLVHVLTIDPADALTVKGSFTASSPASLALSVDGLEMFTAGHKTSDIIERFTYDAAGDTWTSSAMVPATKSLGAILVIP